MRRPVTPRERKFLRDVELVVASGPARGADRLFAAFSQDQLLGSALSLVSSAPLNVGIVTGFYIPAAEPPAAETDGPLGAVLICKLIEMLGGSAYLFTDERCLPVVRSAAKAAGIPPKKVVNLSSSTKSLQSPDNQIETLVGDLSLTHLFAVERPGKSRDGQFYNMRGEPISAYVDDICGPFEQPDCVTIGVGDGGNEIGMGALGADTIGSIVSDGELIASSIPTDFLLICGVSNWAAYSFAAAIAILCEGNESVFENTVSEELETKVLEAMLEAGAVDGVTKQNEMSVDGFTLLQNFSKRREIEQMVRSYLDDR